MPYDAQIAKQADFIRECKAARPPAPAPVSEYEYAPSDAAVGAGKPEPKPRNLVVCCDGTGNEFGGSNTNVVRLYGYLVKDESQLTYYDPGVGTLSPPGVMTRLGRFATQLRGLAFGYGITDDIEDAYRFLMDHYRPGDRVFLFGFSRGAYTVRALAGMIHRCGLLPKGSDNLVRYVTKMYLSGDEKTQDAFKLFFTQTNECKPHFVGVWDTVASVSFFRPTVFKDTNLNEDIKHGRHALAIDERRGMYEPFLWTKAADGQMIRQVWFTGVHSDVGGGYPTHELADITLDWMAWEAVREDLKLLPRWASNLDPGRRGTPNNPLRSGWWALPYSRRAIPDEPDIHPSVVARHTGPEAFDAYRKSITRPVRLVERAAGWVPGLALIAAIGFVVPFLWAGLAVMGGWAGEAARPVWAAAGGWLGSLSRYEQGGVGAAAAVALSLAAWAVRYWNARRPDRGDESAGGGRPAGLG